VKYLTTQEVALVKGKVVLVHAIEDVWVSGDPVAHILNFDARWR
jgi:hypothetical protein